MSKRNTRGTHTTYGMAVSAARTILAITMTIYTKRSKFQIERFRDFTTDMYNGSSVTIASLYLTNIKVFVLTSVPSIFVIDYSANLVGLKSSRLFYLLRSCVVSHRTTNLIVSQHT